MIVSKSGTVIRELQVPADDNWGCLVEALSVELVFDLVFLVESEGAVLREPDNVRGGASTCLLELTDMGLDIAGVCFILVEWTEPEVARILGSDVEVSGAEELGLICVSCEKFWLIAKGFEGFGSVTGFEVLRSWFHNSFFSELS